MGNIVLLDDLTINKIAAGEVIERPASVVKEMVENSIDAGANNITVEIKNGGISYIKITDNGKGILPDDLEIAFERHATSKIRSADDLKTVKSMGFRGEALASIAAIANVEMVSKTESQETGYKIIVEAGEVLEKEEVGCPTGTSITVRNLFFNTPVRYKFLKKDFTESGYIEDVITRATIANPNVAIKLINTGKTVIQTNGNGDLKTVIYSIYGKDIAQGVLPVDYEYEDIKVEGAIGKPEISRSNRSNQIFFVNKRYVKDKIFSSATEQAYKGLLTMGKFAFVVLNITIDPDKVDVNVHPAKLEVRFSEENKVYKAIYHAIKDTLLKNQIINDNSIELKDKLSKNQNINDNSTKLIETILNNQNIDDNSQKISNTTLKNQTIDNDSQELKNTNNQLQNLKDRFDNEIKDILKSGDIRNTNDGLKIENEEYNSTSENINTIKDETINSDDGFNFGNGGPINTADILKKLQDLKNSIENDGVEDNSSNYSFSNTEDINIEKDSIKEDNTQQDNIEQDNTENDNIKEDNIKKDNAEQDNNMGKDDNITEKGNIVENDENDENDENIANPPIEPIIQEPEDDKTDFNEMYQKLFGVRPDEIQEYNKPDEVQQYNKQIENVSIFNNNVENSVVNNGEKFYKFIGIAFEKYIIIEFQNSLYLIDSYIARKKLIYDEFRSNYLSNNRNAQNLFLPDVVTFDKRQMSIYNENEEMLYMEGFKLEPFGDDNTMKITEVPSRCFKLDTKELLIDILDEIGSIAITDVQAKEKKSIEIMAEKLEIAEREELNTENAKKLVDKVLMKNSNFESLNGKQIAFIMTKNEIERKFARK